MSSMSYMEKLLDGVDVEWKALGEIAEIYGGLTGKSKLTLIKETLNTSHTKISSTT